MKSRRRRALGATLFAAWMLVAAVSARAEDPVPYEDQDSNYLMVAYHLVYPVGKLLDIAIFRPLHTLASFGQPDPRRPVTEGEDVSRCIAFRPSRSCSRHD